MVSSAQSIDQVLAAVPSDADAVVTAQLLASAGYSLAEGGFRDGRPAPSRRMQQTGSPIGGRTVASREDIARHISPSAAVLIVRGSDGKTFTVDLRRRLVAALQLQHAVGAGDQYADTLQPPEPKPQVARASTKPFPASDKAHADLLSILAEKQHVEAEVVAIGAKGVRLAREHAAEVKAAEILSAKLDRADVDALVAGIKHEAPRAEKAKLVASTRKIAAFPAAGKAVAEQLALKERELQTIKSRLSAAAMELVGARREEVRERLIPKIGNLAEDLSALIAVEKLQRAIVGEAFAFSSAVSPDLWSGEVVALAFAKAVPNRLRSPQIDPAEITARASALFIQQQKELSL